MMDLSRAFAEKRRLILPIAIAGLVNLVVYAVVIYPRTSSAGALELRAQQAAMARARAAADLRDAEAIRTGTWRRRKATTSANVNLPRFRTGSATRNISAGHPTSHPVA